MSVCIKSSQTKTSDFVIISPRKPGFWGVEVKKYTVTCNYYIWFYSTSKLKFELNHIERRGTYSKWFFPPSLLEWLSLFHSCDLQRSQPFIMWVAIVTHLANHVIYPRKLAIKAAWDYLSSALHSWEHLNQERKRVHLSLINSIKYLVNQLEGGRGTHTRYLTCVDKRTDFYFYISTFNMAEDTKLPCLSPG